MIAIALVVPEAAATEAAAGGVGIDRRHMRADLAIVVGRAMPQRRQRELDGTVVVADERGPQTDDAAAAEIEPDEVADEADRHQRRRETGDDHPLTRHAQARFRGCGGP